MLPWCRPFRAALWALACAAGACSPERQLAQARAVVAEFCAEVAAGRVERARELLVDAERKQGQRIDPAGLKDGYDVGEPREEHGHAVVPVQTRTSSEPVHFVVLHTRAGWRISIAASMHATLGKRFELMRKAIDQAGREMVERFERSQAESGSGSGTGAGAGATPDGR
ncbi:MAG TPA: hypothetical protein VK081_08440 [Planctomycetota bacterium]|nr:hypothetical protein [Planctomycetota bacterium]